MRRTLTLGLVIGLLLTACGAGQSAIPVDVPEETRTPKASAQAVPASELAPAEPATVPTTPPALPDKKDPAEPVVPVAGDPEFAVSVVAPDGTLVTAYFAGDELLLASGGELHVIAKVLSYGPPELVIESSGNPVVVFQGSLGSQWGLLVVDCSDPACAAPPTITSVSEVGDCTDPIVALGPDGFPVIAYNHYFDGADPLCASHLETWLGEVRLVRCHDPACTDHTTTLAEVEYLWTGPFGLDVLPDGRIVTGWSVATGGHPVYAVDQIIAVCDETDCVTSVLRRVPPWQGDFTTGVTPDGTIFATLPPAPDAIPSAPDAIQVLCTPELVCESRELRPTS